MGTTLILAEKNSAAQNFAKALGGMSGTYNGESYQIVHAVGHLYAFPKKVAELVVPEKTEKYSEWKEENLPWDPADFRWKIRPIEDKTDAIDKIKQALAYADEVCIATDNDSTGEGDLLAEEILIANRWNGRTTRMLFDDESPKSVQKAFVNRKEIPPANQYGPFVKAQSRAKFDYLSMQFTRMATILAMKRGHRVVIRQGRLKSVMVYLVGHQLELIANYKKIPFFEARYKDENGNIYKRKESEDIRLHSPADIDLNQFEDSDVVVDSIEIKASMPGKLLDLAGMSSLLAAKGHDPGEILDTYQKMYQDHIVSYPRTDDKKITPAQFEELRDSRFEIAEVVGVDVSLLTHLAPRKKHVTDSATHGANRPGSVVPKTLEELSKYGPSGPAIYELLARNALAILAEDYEYEHQVGHIEKHPEFIGTANIPVKPGFKAIFDSEKKDAPEEGEEEEGIKPLGKRASSFIHEGCNPKPKAPTMKWLVGQGGQLEKYNVGTGATRTSTFKEVTNGSGKNSDMQLLKMSKKGALSMARAGEISYTLLKGCHIASPEVTETLLANMNAVGEFKMRPEDIINSITPLMEHDMQVMKNNAGSIVEGTDSENYVKKEKTEADVFAPTGERVSFNKEFGGHTFTEYEIAELLAGEEISFEAVSSKGIPYTAVGRLAKQSYKGREFWGFKLREREFPKEFLGHKFTEAEIEVLLRKGKKADRTIHVEDLWSTKKNKFFAADLCWDSKKNRIDMSFPKGKK